MSKDLTQITGFEDLEKQLKRLANDSLKRREILKILGQVANTTVKAAKALTPSASNIKAGSKSYARKKRQVGKKVIQDNYTAGFGKISIGKKTMTRARIPMLVVRPKNITINGNKKYGGFYIRQFVILGTKYQKSNPIMNKAFEKTKRKVSTESETKVSRYLQKQINKLSNA